jgi:GAF domain-containing protein
MSTFARRRNRSVACLPLVKQGELVALLYLENKLASNVFTPERLKILEVLASQAAISLENSRLYHEIQRAEAQVEQAYLRLAEAQRLSKTGSFITDLLADDHNWSEEAFRIFEFDPATKVTVQMIRDMVHPDDLPSFDAVIARGMTGTDVDFVFRIVTLEVP